MNFPRFKDLSINSTKAPLNTHLIWEHSTYGIVIVDSTDQTVLLISTDEGDNWSVIDLSDNTNSYKIQAGWLDGNDLWLVSCDNDGTADDFEVFYIELDDSNDCNPVGVSAGADANTVYAFDIFKIGVNLYVIALEDRAALASWYWWDVDTAPFTEITGGAQTFPVDAMSPCVIIGTDAYSVFSYTPAVTRIVIIKFDSVAPGLDAVYDTTDYVLNADKNRSGLAYDGSDLIYMSLKKNAGGLDYLIVYSIGDDTLTELDRIDVGIQLDRNTATGVLEKGFGITNKITYEIKTKRGGLTQLQDLSSQVSGNIIAITDNYIFSINSGGNWDVYGFQDITSEISSISYGAGIMGIPKKGVLMIHPDFENRWSKGDSIKFDDQYGQLEFWGKIIYKNQNKRGLYVIKFNSFTNEVLTNTYSKTYSADDTDTKQKDIIDNACNFCYRSSSIVGTTTTYDYVYNRAIIYLFWLARRLERQVPYIEPDGKIWTKLYSALTAEDMIYPGTYNFKNEADGTTDTAIGLIDSITANDSTYSGVIIASEDGHRKVLDINASGDNGKNTQYFHNFSSTQTIATFEFWIKFIDNGTGDYFFIIQDAANALVQLQYSNSSNNLSAYHAATTTSVGKTADTWIHIRAKFDTDTDHQWVWIDGVSLISDVAFVSSNTSSGATKCRWQTLGAAANDDLQQIIDAVGESWDPAYTVGDNEVAWDLNNHWQDVRFVDIPGLEEMIQGFFDGNSGITRNTIRYRDNAQTIRPIAATRDPIEQLKGILPLNEFRDPKIEASTEAEQLGDNRYAIWAADTLFLGLRVAGQGYLQPGKTIHIENTGQITVAESNLLLLSFIRDPKNDVYTQMILSDNIIFPSEFSNIDNTTPQQTHTSIVQAFENQADIIAHLTPEGGLALRLTNKTGVNSIKGTIVEAHAATDNAFRVCDADSVESFGIVYEDGVADGSECLVVVGGRCQVLLKDATLSTRNNWVEVSDVAGRADATNASPAAAPAHFKEIGHCIESKGADTDVLAFIMLHFL